MITRRCVQASSITELYTGRLFMLCIVICESEIDWEHQLANLLLFVTNFSSVLPPFFTPGTVPFRRYKGKIKLGVVSIHMNVNTNTVCNFKDR